LPPEQSAHPPKNEGIGSEDESDGELEHESKKEKKEVECKLWRQTFRIIPAITTS
jgi:hypothetical protein